MGIGHPPCGRRKSQCEQRRAARRSAVAVRRRIGRLVALVPRLPLALSGSAARLLPRSVCAGGRRRQRRQDDWRARSTRWGASRPCWGSSSTSGPVAAVRRGSSWRRADCARCCCSLCCFCHRCCVGFVESDGGFETAAVCAAAGEVRAGALGRVACARGRRRGGLNHVPAERVGGPEPARQQLPRLRRQNHKVLARDQPGSQVAAVRSHSSRAPLGRRRRIARLCGVTLPVVAVH